MTRTGCSDGPAVGSGRLDRIVDNVLDATVVPGFSRISYAIRSPQAGWRPIGSYDLRGHTVVVSGVTFGLGASDGDNCARSTPSCTNADALLAERTTTSEGHGVTIATMYSGRS